MAGNHIFTLTNTPNIIAGKVISLPMKVVGTMSPIQAVSENLD